MKKIINVAPWSIGEWTWLQGKTPALTAAAWEFFGPNPVRFWERLVITERLSRIRACWQAARAFRRGEADIIVAHGPLYAFWVAFFLPKKRQRGTFLAFSFNFTELPKDRMLRFMRRHFQKIDRFTTYSALEVDLYAQTFDIAKEKIDMIHWGVSPPAPSALGPFVKGKYIAAIGGEGRDYSTLFEAARDMPDYRFVVVAREHNLLNLEIPKNVTCFKNLPLPETMNILLNATIAVVPLKTSRTPCGHVTIVAGMYLAKAQVVSYSEGIVDYIEDGKTGLHARAGDAADLKEKTTGLLTCETLREEISENALRFATTFCSESSTTDYFDKIVTLLP